MTNREIALEYLRRLSAGRIEEAFDLTREDVRFGGPDRSTMTREDMRRLFAFVLPKFAGPVEQKITGVTAEGDRVAIEATGKAPLVSGKTYDNVYHFLFEFAGGKIIAIREYCDTRVLSLLQD